MKITPPMAVLLVLVAVSGIAMTILAAVDGTLTGDWVDATAPVGYPAVGLLLIAMAGLGVLVFLGTLAIFLIMATSGSRTAHAQP